MMKPSFFENTSGAQSAARISAASATLPEALYEALKAKILSGELGPGAALREHHLGSEHGVSGLPVRLALTRLAAEGLAEQRPHRGFFVSRITLHDLREAFELRLVIEPAVARLAAERVDERHVAALRRHCRKPGKAAAARSNTTQDIADDVEFHRLLAEIGRNRQLQAAVQRFWNQYVRIGYLLKCERRLILGDGHSRSGHAAIAEAVLARDGDLAYARMLEHCQSAERNLAFIAAELEHQHAQTVSV